MFTDKSLTTDNTTDNNNRLNSSSTSTTATSFTTTTSAGHCSDSEASFWKFDHTRPLPGRFV